MCTNVRPPGGPHESRADSHPFGLDPEIATRREDDDPGVVGGPTYFEALQEASYGLFLIELW